MCGYLFINKYDLWVYMQDAVNMSCNFTVTQEYECMNNQIYHYT